MATPSSTSARLTSYGSQSARSNSAYAAALTANALADTTRRRGAERSRGDLRSPKVRRQ